MIHGYAGRIKCSSTDKAVATAPHRASVCARESREPRACETLNQSGVGGNEGGCREP